MTRLSCHRFRSNEVLLLSGIAYNLANLWRRLVLPRKIDNGSSVPVPRWIIVDLHAALH